jgi:membrane-bound metal-dependent hydrolase YbcI (DUF457 family)
MFVGHLSLAFAAKRFSPRTSLGWTVAAVSTLDLVWPVFVLSGAERVRIVPGATAFTPLVFDSYPWSHSLAMATVWGLALALLARARGVERRVATLIAALVVSHWVLDWITHAADMPLWPGSSPRFGLALWDSIAGTYAVEGAMWLVGLGLYFSVRRPAGWQGWVALGALVLLCTFVWAGGPWVPPPPSTQALGWFALVGGWLTIPWAIWADRNMKPERT